MSNPAAELLVAQFQSAHDWVNGTVGDVNNDQAHWKPDGLPSPIGAQFIHIVTSEDVFVNMLKGTAPLFSNTPTGASEMPPQGDWREWSNAVEVDMDAARKYSQAVFQATADYLASLSDADVSAEIDLTGQGFGKQSRGQVLSILLLNTYSHVGEISALKGLQGHKGYPA